MPNARDQRLEEIRIFESHAWTVRCILLFDKQEDSCIEESGEQRAATTSSFLLTQRQLFTIVLPMFPAIKPWKRLSDQ